MNRLSIIDSKSVPTSDELYGVASFIITAARPEIAPGGGK